MDDCKSKGRVLIVGHEQDLAEMLGFGLTCREYDSVITTSSRSALEMIERSETQPNPFVLYVFDVALHDMPYNEFIEYVSRLNGRVPILLVTGFQDDREPILASEGTYTIDFCSDLRNCQQSKKESPYMVFVRAVDDICSGVPLNPNCTRRES
ncbi:MAG: hypothetical protein ABII01_07250 [Candidatus Woesearchaeota archaeon]